MVLIPTMPGAVSRHHRVGRHVLRDLGAGGEHRVRADSAELMNAAHPGRDHPFVEHAMAGYLSGVGQDRMVADEAVVRDVYIVHHQHVVADAREHPAALGAAVDGGELADAVVVADFQARGLVVIF